MVSPALIRHAHVPSGATTILISTGPSPVSSAVITMKPSSLTRMPAIPQPNAVQRKPHYGLGVPRRGCGGLPASRVRAVDRFSQRLDRRRRLAQAARQRLGIVGPRHHGRVAGAEEGRQRLDTRPSP